MIRTEAIIGVEDVEKSSEWYQKLLDCKSRHGGNTFEVLTDTDGTVILCLHKWGEHSHPTLTSPIIANGNGLILYIKVSNLDTVWSSANKMQSTIEAAPH